MKESTNVFYPGDIVKINLDTSLLHEKEGIVTNVTPSTVAVKIDNREDAFWKDDVILVKRHKK